MNIVIANYLVKNDILNCLINNYCLEYRYINM